MRIRRDVAEDMLLAAVLAALSVITYDTSYPGPEAAIALPEPVWQVVYPGLLIAECLPILGRRRRPLLMLALLGCVIVAYTTIASSGGRGSGTTIGILIYSATVYFGRRRGLLAAALAFPIDLLLLGGPHPPETVDVLTAAFAMLLCFGIGEVVRRRRLETALALRDATAEAARAARAEAERDARIRDAVNTERIRIARELHDIVAHHLGFIVLEAGAARRLAAHDPDRGVQALTRIEESGRIGMTEMRRLLGILRAPGNAPGQIDAPAPSLADLPAIAKAGELDVTVHTSGTPRPLPAGLELNAYRIVQEALTNVTKHARATAATVRINFGTAALTVEVLDNGAGAVSSAGPRPAGSGHGLVGMRERVEMFGGDLWTGPEPSGGYRVHVRFPLDSTPAAT